MASATLPCTGASARTIAAGSPAKASASGCALTSPSSISATKFSGRLISFFIVSSYRLLRPGGDETSQAPRVDDHHQKKERAPGHVHREIADLEQVQPARQELQRQDREHKAADLAETAVGVDPAEHRDQDREQEVGLAVVGLGGVRPRRDDQSRERRQEPADQIGAERRCGNCRCRRSARRAGSCRRDRRASRSSSS